MVGKIKAYLYASNRQVGLIKPQDLRWGFLAEYLLLGVAYSNIRSTPSKSGWLAVPLIPFVVRLNRVRTTSSMVISRTCGMGLEDFDRIGDNPLLLFRNANDRFCCELREIVEEGVSVIKSFSLLLTA